MIFLELFSIHTAWYNTSMKFRKIIYLNTAILASILISSPVLAEGKLSSIKNEIATIESNIADNQKKIESKKAELSSKEKEMATEKITSKEEVEESEPAYQEIQKLSNELTNLRSDLKVTKNAVLDLEYRIEKSEKEIINRRKELNQSWNLAKLKKGWQGAIDLLKNRDTVSEGLQNDKTEAKQQLKDKNTKKREIETKIASKSSEYTNKYNELVKAKVSLKENEQSSSTLYKEHSEIKSKITELEALNDKLQSELISKEKKKNEIESNLYKYALNDENTLFANEEDQALFERTKDIIDSGDEGLTKHTRQIRHFIMAKFDIKQVGGVREDDDGTGHGHSSGMALDYMVDKKTGDKLAKYLEANFKDLGIYYIIWEQKYYMDMPNIYGKSNAWNLMPDRGGATANHYDHVHVSFAK